jgi:hypothetical protein
MAGAFVQGPGCGCCGSSTCQSITTSDTMYLTYNGGGGGSDVGPTALTYDSSIGAWTGSQGGFVTFDCSFASVTWTVYYAVKPSTNPGCYWVTRGYKFLSCGSFTVAKAGANGITWVDRGSGNYIGISGLCLATPGAGGECYGGAVQEVCCSTAGPYVAKETPPCTVTQLGVLPGWSCATLTLKNAP